MILLVYIISFLILQSFSLYTKNYRKCVLGNFVGKEFSALEIQRVPIIKSLIDNNPVPSPTKKVEYLEEFHFIFHNYIAAGASGQVYMVEQIFKDPIVPGLLKSEPKIVKRFFSEDVQGFEQENYVMDKLGYQMHWSKQDKTFRIPGSQQQAEQAQNTQGATMAVYPYNVFKVLRDVQDIDEYKLPILMYQICADLSRAHKNGIIHNDLKLGNIIVTKPNPFYSDLFRAKIIDWNLATFYYLGYSSSYKKGTPCYYSPQQLFRSQHVTPALDVWVIGVTLFYHIAGKKPYPVKCNADKNNNIQAITSLVGTQSMIQMFSKYRYNYDRSIRQKLNDIILKNPKKYEKQANLLNLVPDDMKHYFTKDLIQLFKWIFQADPEKRPTMEEIINHAYFDQVRHLPAMYAAKNNQKQEDVLAKQAEIQAKQRQKQIALDGEKKAQQQFVQDQHKKLEQLKNKLIQDNIIPKQALQHQDKNIANQPKITPVIANQQIIKEILPKVNPEIVQPDNTPIINPEIVQPDNIDESHKKASIPNPTISQHPNSQPTKTSDQIPLIQKFRQNKKSVQANKNNQ